MKHIHLIQIEPDLLAWIVRKEVTFRCLNIEKAKERMTGPKNPINTSPAPGLDETFVR